MELDEIWIEQIYHALSEDTSLFFE